MEVYFLIFDYFFLILALIFEISPMHIVCGQHSARISLPN